ncbi:FAS1-like dehydratase domain-containing protein [Streptomyces sp. NPDC055078]
MPKTTLDPATPLGRYYEQMKKREGERSTRRLGRVEAVTIARYARAIGAGDPIHFDPDAARAQGFPDVVAPANMLVAIAEWGAGEPESALGRDGVPLLAADDAGAELRAMGAGEEMEFVAPVVAGTELVRDEIQESVVAKDTRGGPCVFVSTDLVFRTPDGEVFMRSRKTVVRRNPVEETR